MSSEIEELMIAFTRARTGASLQELLLDLSPLVANTAVSINRAITESMLSPGMDDTSIIGAISSFEGTLGRRRILAALRRTRIISPDAQIIRMMLPGSAPSMRSIIRATAEHHGKAPEMLMSGTAAENALARFEASWIAVRLFEHPLMEAAEALSRNHTTVLGGMNKVDIRIKRSPILLDSLLRIADDADMEAINKHAALVKEGPEGPSTSHQ